MNLPRLFIAIVAVFIGVFATDFVIHGVLLKDEYAATKELWRPEAEMQARMPWMMLGQLVAAVTFVLLWAMGFAANPSPGRAVAFGFLIALFSHAGALISYAVQPLPGTLVAKWIAAAVVQGIVLALVVCYIYRRPADGR